MNSNITDEELVKKSFEDISYFGELFSRYEKKLLHYILRISYFSLEEAEEVLQDSFLKAWENLNEFDTSLKFSSWIYRIVHNTTISSWKKTQTKGQENLVVLEEEVFKNIPSALDIENSMQKKFTAKEVREVLNVMDEKYKEVLVLKFLEEKNYDEISDILKKPAGTIATLINRAKKQFQILAKQKNYFSL